MAALDPVNKNTRIARLCHGTIEQRIEAVRWELDRTYRRVLKGIIAPDVGRTLVQVLSTLLRDYRASEAERRLAAIEKQLELLEQQSRQLEQRKAA